MLLGRCVSRHFFRFKMELEGYFGFFERGTVYDVTSILRGRHVLQATDNSKGKHSSLNGAIVRLLRLSLYPEYVMAPNCLSHRDRFLALLRF